MWACLKARRSRSSTRAAHGGDLWPLRRQRVGGEEKPAEPEKTAAACVSAATPQLTAERRFVRVGASQGDEVAILEGVKAGEEVITSGQLKLHPDTAIKVDNSRPLTPQAQRPRQ